MFPTAYEADRHADAVDTSVECDDVGAIGRRHVQVTCAQVGEVTSVSRAGGSLQVRHVYCPQLYAAGMVLAKCTT